SLEGDRADRAFDLERHGSRRSFEIEVEAQRRSPQAAGTGGRPRKAPREGCDILPRLIDTRADCCTSIEGWPNDAARRLQPSEKTIAFCEGSRTSRPSDLVSKGMLADRRRASTSARAASPGSLTTKCLRPIASGGGGGAP